MSDDWRVLLDRALDGETLSDAEVRALADSLEADGAAEWLGFDAALRETLAPSAVAVSKERLLAEATLREKAATARQAPSWRRRAWLAAGAAAAVVAIVAGWLLARPGYPVPQASGAYELIRGGKSAGGAWPLRRGDTLVAREGGARLSLGGYCDVALAPDAMAVVRGEPGAEMVELRRGKATSHVTPERGRFTLLTPLGSLEVKGTEFITTVESPDGQEGGDEMSGLRKTVVTVLVVSGAVAFQFGGETGLLSAGMSQAFGAEEGEKPTVPEGLRGFRGILRGPVLTKGEGGLVLRLDRIHKVWKGSEAKDPGKLETAIGKLVPLRVLDRSGPRIREAFAAIKAGDGIEVGAAYREGRMVIVELLRKLGADAPKEEPEKPKEEEPRLLEGARGFNGIFVGTIVEKGETKFGLKVEKVARKFKGNRARNPEAAVGTTVTMTLRWKGRLLERLVPKLRELKAGDRVEVGAVHVEGNVFANVELLRKAERPPTEEKEKTE